MRSGEMETVAGVLARATPALLVTSVADQRATWDGFAGDVPDGVVVTAVEEGGVPAERVRAPGAAADALVVHFHGGGYVIGSPRSHRPMAARLSAASGATVVVPEYRLAPEHRFPAAVDDAVAVLEAAMAEVGPGRVAVSGDSAGGGLALAATVAAGRPPAALVCWSPWVDLSASGVLGTAGASAGPGGDEVVISRDWLEHCARSYLADGDGVDPRASPLRGDLAGLPPLLVLVGTAELLLPDARRLAERARAAGTQVELVEFGGAIHLWMVFAPGAPESVEAFGRAGAFLRARLDVAAVP